MVKFKGIAMNQYIVMNQYMYSILEFPLLGVWLCHLLVIKGFVTNNAFEKCRFSKLILNANLTLSLGLVMPYLLLVIFRTLPVYNFVYPILIIGISSLIMAWVDGKNTEEGLNG